MLFKYCFEALCAIPPTPISELTVLSILCGCRAALVRWTLGMYQQQPFPLPSSTSSVSTQIPASHPLYRTAHPCSHPRLLMCFGSRAEPSKPTHWTAEQQPSTQALRHWAGSAHVKRKTEQAPPKKATIFIRDVTPTIFIRKNWILNWEKCILLEERKGKVCYEIHRNRKWVLLNS